MNPIVARYKIPVLISIVISLVILVLGILFNGVASPWVGVLVFVGAILGALMMDLEFILYAYIIEPNSPASLSIKTFVRANGFGGYVRYLNENEYSFTELPLRSVLFQVLLMIFAYYVVITGGHYFGVALILSMLATIFYMQIIELNKLGNLDRWFWLYNGDVNRDQSIAYLCGLGLAFLGVFFFI